MPISSQPQAKPRSLVIGNAVLVRARLRDKTGQLIDPSDLTLLVRGPAGGDPVSYDMVPTDADPFVAEGAFLPNVAGVWYYRIESSNPAAAFESAVTITQSNVES